MASKLRAEVERAGEPGDVRAAIFGRVWCRHGASELAWERICPNECHRRGPERWVGCCRVNPSTAMVTAATVVAHARRLHCGCDERFWMRHGPEWPQSGVPFGIQPLDWRLTADDVATVGTWTRYPMGEGC